MEKLRFIQLLILSKQTELSNLFTLSPTKNLITADDNGQGKSTLVKSLLWALGCDCVFGVDWKSFGISCLVEFTINDKLHKIYRDEHGLYYRNNETKKKFSKITGDYSEFFAKLVGFDLLLVNQQGKLEIPPPAFYFLPFYINQTDGWIDTWNGFERLGQFKSFKTNVVKFHTGYINKIYFDLEKQIKEQNQLKEHSNEKIDKLDKTVATIEELIAPTTVSGFGLNFESIQTELQGDLDELLGNEAEWARDLNLLQSDKYFLTQQLKAVERAIKDTEADYIFATENLEAEIKCPTCGVLHDNSLIERSAILLDKNELVDEKKYLSQLLSETTKKIHDLNGELKVIRNKISFINEKYTLSDNMPFNLDDYVKNIAPSILKININDAKTKQYELISIYENEAKTLRKEQNQLLLQKNKKKLNEEFVNIFHKIKIKLNLRDINTEMIKAPTDYSKLKKVNGGDAEKTRIILAYRLTILELIKMRQTEVISPLIIDTPNQQDQNADNYQVIIDYLNNHLNDDTQIILCAMSNSIVDEYSKNAHIIKLNSKKILNNDCYLEHKKIVDDFIKNFEYD
ncbi:hypothetical protein [Psychrobacter sanguinis]|uniref:hypothetical protein n=1 Tax=Psychrobacter sanguinis TaxID=861445 RepID=UPI00191A9DC2|nr:hypothetical protein [Psychrobacter sanguinis]MCC3344556.1 hypothetical protein [Psychrobacter sanguinis]